MNLCIDKLGVWKQLDIQVKDIDHSYQVKSALWAAKWLQIDPSHIVFLVFVSRGALMNLKDYVF